MTCSHDPSKFVPLLAQLIPSTNSGKEGSRERETYQQSSQHYAYYNSTPTPSSVSAQQQPHSKPRRWVYQSRNKHQYVSTSLHTSPIFSPQTNQAPFPPYAPPPHLPLFSVTQDNQHTSSSATSSCGVRTP